MARPPLDLGFLEPFEEAALATSVHFPSKAGGLPAWLDFSGLPPTEQLTCETCGDPLAFLLQLYAPQDAIEHASHRALYVFCCMKGGCHRAAGQRSFRVFRCQLPESNPYYGTDPPAPGDDVETAWLQHRGAVHARLCCVCGAPAPKSCGACKKAHYCSRAHQTLHWRCGHKEGCAVLAASPEERAAFIALEQPASEAARTALFKEFEIATEPAGDDEDNARADDSGDSDSDDDPEGERARVEEYRKTVKKMHLDNEEGEDADLDELFARFDKSDRQFSLFETVVKRAPDQVVRYQRRATPLWISSSQVPASGDIPPCPLCKAPRTFEFQVLPQLLYYLRVDDQLPADKVAGGIDWGVLAIYTCDHNCQIAGDCHYAVEYLWQQALA